MKKTKLLIGTLVLSTGLMGTGYAYWTKQLTVNTTVSSANFDVYFSGQSAEQTDSSEAVDNTHNTLTSALKDSKTNQSASKGDLVEYAWDNIYPGSEVQLSYTITSTSTIPVKAQPVYTLAQSSDSTLAGALDFTVGSTTYHGFSAFKTAMEASALELDKASVTTPVSEQITVIVSLDQEVTDLNTINKSFGFDIGMLWGQFNDATIAASTEPTTQPTIEPTPTTTPRPTHKPGRQ